MPRNVDPGTIRVGKGLAPEGTVEDNSLRYPERDADPLRVHIHDPSRAHMAATIGIVDEADCYVSDEVEGALQELCASSGAGRLNGMIAGGTFEELGCVANGSAGGGHTTLTLCSPTEIMMNGSVFDAAGLTVNIPDGNVVYYIYLDTSPPSPSYRELVAKTASPPEVEEGIPDATFGPDSIEQVMLAKVTKAGPDVTVWQDARFFVRNLDRKVQYSSRQGENVDAWSEGCFASLQAFFFWAQYYGDTGTSEEEKGTVLIRGTHSITHSFDVPSDHLQFVGDGEAVIELNGVGAPFDAITFANKSDLTFRNLTIKANVNGCRGIVGSGQYTDITIEDCRFVNGDGNFNTCISLLGGPANLRLLVRDCFMETENIGVEADGCGNTSSPGIYIEDSVVKGADSGVANTMGISLGALGTPSVDVQINRCVISGLEQGINLKDTHRCQVSHSTMTDVASGIVLPATGGQTLDTKIMDNSITLSDNNSLHGIYIDGGHQQIGIFNNYVRNLLDGGHPSEPFGIHVSAQKGSEEVDVRIEGNTVIGFYDAANSHGHGIACWEGTVAGSEGTGIGAVITGNTLSRCDISIEGWLDITITGNNIDAAAAAGLTPGPTVDGLINIHKFENATVSGNIIDARAVVPMGISVRLGMHVTLTGNIVRSPIGAGIWLAADYGGMAVAYLRKFTVSANTVDCYLSVQVPPTANGIHVSGQAEGCPQQGVIDGNNVTRCQHGILLIGKNPTVPVIDVVVSNNYVAQCAMSQDGGFQDFNFPAAGSKAIGCLFSKSINITGNNIAKTGVVIEEYSDTPIVIPDDIWARPIYVLNSGLVSITNNEINDSAAQVSGNSQDISVLTGNAGQTFTSSACVISDNTISTSDATAPEQHNCIVVWADDPNGNEVTVQEVRVSGNTMHSHLGLAGLGFGHGVQLLVGNNAKILGGVVENNTIENYLVSGIDITVGVNPPSADSAVDSIQVTNNRMTSTDGVGSEIAGITLVGQAPLQHNVYLNQIAINDNVVSKGFGNGIQMDFTAPNFGFVGLDNFTVDGNNIANLAVDLATHPDGPCGIEIRADGGDNHMIMTNFPQWDVQGIGQIRVTNNVVTRLARGLDIFIQGCLLCTGLDIDNNRFHGYGTNTYGPTADFLVRVFMFVNNGVPSLMKYFSFSGNSSELIEQDRQIDNVFLRFQGVSAEIVKITDNIINSSTHYGTSMGMHGRSVVLWHFGDANLDLVVKDVLIEGNLCGGGIAVRVDNASVKGLDVLANQITIPIIVDDVHKSHPLVVYIDSQKTSNRDVQRVALCNNSVTGGLDGIFFQSEDNELVEGIVIDGNRVADALRTGIMFLVDQEPSAAYYGQAVRNVKVTDNAITHFTGGSGLNGIVYAAGQTRTESFEVSRNQIYNAEDRAIWMMLGGHAAVASNHDRNIHVDDNVIDWCGTGATSVPLVEISTDPASLLSGADEISTVSMSRNSVANCGNDTGLVVFYLDLDPYGGGCYDVDVSGNMMTQITGQAKGTKIYGSGIEMDLPATYRLQVTDNIIEATGYDGNAGYGILLNWVGDCTLHGVNVTRNSIKCDTDNITAGIRFNTHDADFEIQNVRIAENQIEADSPEECYYGIHWNGKSGATAYTGYYESIVIENNNITNFKNGIRFDQCDGGYQHSNVAGRNSSTSHNKVQDCSIRGIYWANGGPGAKGGNTHGLLVNHNSVITSYDSVIDSGPTAYMIDVSLGRGQWLYTGKANIHMVSVDFNHCYFTSPDPGVMPNWGGIDLTAGFIDATNLATPIPTAMSTTSINGNHVRNVGHSGIHFRTTSWMEVSDQTVTEMGHAQQCTVSNNVVRCGGTIDLLEGLIWIECVWATLRGFTFQGNNVRHTMDSSSAYGIHFETDYNTASSIPQNKNNWAWNVQGNIAACDSGRASTKTSWDGGIKPEEGVVVGNQNEDNNIPADDFEGLNFDFGGPHALNLKM